MFMLNFEKIDSLKLSHEYINFAFIIIFGN